MYLSHRLQWVSQERGWEDNRLCKHTHKTRRMCLRCPIWSENCHIRMVCSHIGAQQSLASLTTKGLFGWTWGDRKAGCCRTTVTVRILIMTSWGSWLRCLSKHRWQGGQGTHVDLTALLHCGHSTEAKGGPSLGSPRQSNELYAHSPLHEDFVVP